MADCAQCGFGYVKTIPGNVRAHRNYHDRAVYGPRTQLRDGVYFVNPCSRRGLRQLAYGAAQIAQRDSGYDFPAFTVWDTVDAEHQPELAIQVVNHRVVGLIVTRMRPSDCRATLASFEDWEDGWRPTAVERVPETQRRSIDMIWVLKRSRGGGDIAWTLAQAIAEHCGIAVNGLAHSLPFTEAAVRFWTKRGLTNIYFGLRHC